MILGLFVYPVDVGPAALYLVVPVTLAVATVYKTLRTRSLRRLPLEIAWLSFCILAGMAGLMVGLWLLLRFWVTGS